MNKKIKVIIIKSQHVTNNGNDYVWIMAKDKKGIKYTGVLTKKDQQEE